jgi:hypothetical protein
MSDTRARSVLPASILAWLLLGTSAATAGGPACAAGMFQFPAAYPVGTYPVDVIAADFTGDGIPDVATLTALYYGSAVSVLVGNPDGTFQPAIQTTLSESVYAFVAGDFKKDGVLDLAFSVQGPYPQTPEVWVLPGNGDGTFQAPISSPASHNFNHMAAGAFVTGGETGIAAVWGEQSVSLMNGNGDGTFSAETSFPTSISSGDLAIGDLDGDGALDVVTTSSGSIAALLGNGDGTLGTPHLSIGGKGVQSPVIADFDEDGKGDVALSTQSYVAILIGLGDGTFQAPRDFPAGISTGDLVAGDFDGDGHVDVVVENLYNSYAGVVRVLLGAGDGTLTLGSGYTTPSIRAMAAADLGADGTLDLVVTTSDPSLVWALLGNGDGTLQAVRSDAATTVTGLAAADFDGDGLPDLAMIPGNQNRIQVFRQTPSSYVLETTIVEANGVLAIGTGDFDEDGNQDIVAVTYTGDALQLVLGNGDGTFRPPVSFPVPFYGPSTLTVADFDENGHLDVGVTASGGSFQYGFHVFPGNGDGTLGADIQSQIEYLPNAVAAGLLNGDGHLDLVLANGAYYSGANSISVALGNGDGTFGAPTEYPFGVDPRSVAIADFDGDGIRDIAAANFGSGVLSLFHGVGDGTFSDPTFVGLGARAYTVVAADFDGDGDPDLVTANSDFSSATVLENLGGGAFANPVSYPVGRTPIPALVTDVLGNGTPDVVIGNTGDLGGLSILLNTRLSVAPLRDGGGCIGGSATIRALAGGFGKLSYQWRKDGAPISDGGPVSGATTALLTISPASAGDAGSYDVVVTDACTTVTSSAASMIIEDPPAAPVIVTAASALPDIATDASVTGAPGHGYLWTVTNGTIVSGQGTSHIQFRAPLPGPVVLEVVESSAPGCSASSGSLPVAVDFGDVPPSHPFHDDIVTLALSGVTAGCGGGNYCPADPVTRSQMAVFLLKANFGSDHQPNQFGPVFADVPNGSFACYWINELWSYGITTGCGNGNYCPDASVTRAQMAVFIERTLGNPYPPPAVGIFGDVPTDAFAANYIEALYDGGITGGCSLSPLLYCPDSLVTRGQMAVFLVRAFLGP